MSSLPISAPVEGQKTSPRSRAIYLPERSVPIGEANRYAESTDPYKFTGCYRSRNVCRHHARDRSGRKAHGGLLGFARGRLFDCAAASRSEAATPLRMTNLVQY